MGDPTPRRQLPALLLLLACGACGLTADPAIAARIARVDGERLMTHVQALADIGPRPEYDGAATERTLAYIEETLASYGYRTWRETWELGPPPRCVALVRPADDPDGEPVELEQPPTLMSAGPRAVSALGARLREQGWKVLGYTMSTAANPPDVPRQGFNVLAELRGRDDPATVLELSAHYDSVPFSPGADDNGSGVAAILETARVLADAIPARTLRFCFFGAEESGFDGSRHHLQVLEETPDERLAGLLNLDSVGFTNRAEDSQRAPLRIPLIASLPYTGDFITVLGNWSSGWLGNCFEDAADAYVPELRYFSANRIGGWFGDAHRSDHAGYWDRGLSAIFLTDTTEFRGDTYHVPGDTPDTLDPLFLRQVTQAVAATLLVWAGNAGGPAPAP
jgi:hypothetical protein